jgi:photosystem II stability/assembly factor-like uncharacterized protein
MKTNIFLFAIILTCSTLFGQSGWIIQNPGTTNHILSVSFPNSSTGFACGWYATLRKTTNGGDNWFSLTSPTSNSYQSIFFTDINTGYAVGQNGTIIKTTNSGTNWFVLNSGTSNLLLIVDFVNTNTGFVVGYSGTVLKTIDAGQTWTPQNPGTTVNLLCVKFIDVNTGYISGDFAKVLKTTDGGNTWISIVSGLSNNLGKMSFVNANTGYIPGTNGAIFKTTNGGQYFTLINSGNVNYLISACFKSVNTGYISGANGTVVKTTNAGVNWVTQVTPTTNELHWIYFLNDLTGWACGYNGTIIKTTTGGVYTPIPNAPVLISPPNNSNNIGLTPLLTWNASTNATSYHVQLSTTPNFINIIDSASVTSTSYSVPSGKLNASLTYFWRVNAKNSFGTSPWSEVWNFSTTQAPAAPLLYFPANNSLNVILTPRFSWYSVSNVQNYNFQISTNSTFSNIIDSITTIDTSYLIPAGKLNISTSYYWRVRAGNSYGFGNWSIVFTFTTIGAPVAPTLISPPNGALGVSNVPLMDWGDVSGATSYKIIISTVSNFTVITDSSTVVASQYQVPSGKLQNLITYFWRVYATNQYGNSPWSATWMFTVYPSNIEVIAGKTPSNFNIYQNYPNPFNPTTKIKFDIPKVSVVKIVVYDIKGSQLEVLLDGTLQPGTFEYKWDASKYSSGMYFVRLISPEFTAIKKMMLIK